MPKSLSRPSDRSTASRSICTNCMHDGDCAFQRNAAAPIHFCEEHEAERKQEPVRVMVASIAPAQTIPGLCGSCAHVEHCALRDPERITYHCEHYE